MVDDTRKQFGGRKVLEESEFKKLTANSRDWLIYQLLSDRSKETIIKAMAGRLEKEIKSEHISGVNIEEQAKQAPKGETTVRETSILKNVKIVHETEKAFIVNLIGTQFTAVVAKSHLAEEYSKDDVRTDLIFKNDRKWALEKLKWEEKT